MEGCAMGQVLHGSARTTAAVRRAIQQSQASLRGLARRHGLNPKTVAKWKKRPSVQDERTGPKEPRSTVLSIEEEAIIVAFRRHTLLPLDDCLYALQATLPHLTRSSLHRCLQRHGLSRLPTSPSVARTGSICGRSFAGVVVASLNPEHLTRFYERLDLGSSASISLVGNDGVVRSSGGSAGDFALGQDLSRTEIFARIEAGANATFEFANSSDAEPQFVTIRKVRGHPLWISVSVAKSDIYKGSRASLRINLAGGLLLTIIILTALERVFRTEARKQEAEVDVARLASE